MARKGGKDRGLVYKNNAWWVRLYANSQERWYRCDNKSQAKALYGRLKAEHREEKYFPKDKRYPFVAIARDYEAVVDATRHGRAGDDRARVQKWIDVFGSQNAKTIKPDQVERALMGLRTSGHKPATVHRYFTVVKAILNRIPELKVVRAQICKHVRIPKYHNEIVRYLSDEQEMLLLHTLPDKYRPITILALNTGLRQSELLRLKWSDVDWQTGILNISRTKDIKAHRVPMNSTVQQLLATLEFQGKPDGNDSLFQFPDRALRRAFNKTITKIGISPFRFHDLRHTFASRLAMRGENDRTIMALGGWKSPAMLSRYAHLSPAHLWRAVEGLAQNETGSKTGIDVARRVGEKIEVLGKIW